MGAVWASNGNVVKSGSQNMRRSIITLVRKVDNSQSTKTQLAEKAAHDIPTADRYYDYTEGYRTQTIPFNRMVRRCILGR